MGEEDSVRRKLRGEDKGKGGRRKRRWKRRKEEEGGMERQRRMGNSKVLQ